MKSKTFEVDFMYESSRVVWKPQTKIFIRHSSRKMQ